MQNKIKNGLVYSSASINEYKEIYTIYKWNNLVTGKKVFNTLGLTGDLLSFPQSGEVESHNWEVCQLVKEEANKYFAPGVCMKEEIKIEYVGYAAMLMTYYWYRNNGEASIECVPYIREGDFTDFRERVLNYIGVNSNDKSWIKRAISDCAHDFFQKELKHNTRQLPDGPYLSPAGREIAWEDAADIIFTSCQVLEMQRLGFA